MSKEDLRKKWIGQTTDSNDDEKAHANENKKLQSKYCSRFRFSLHTELESYTS